MGEQESGRLCFEEGKGGKAIVHYIINGETQQLIGLCLRKQTYVLLNAALNHMLRMAG